LQNLTCGSDLFRGGRQNWKVRAAISGLMQFQRQHHKDREMDTTLCALILQRSNVIQRDLLPELRN
jgi:hypothetical protein